MKGSILLRPPFDKKVRTIHMAAVFKSLENCSRQGSWAVYLPENMFKVAKLYCFHNLFLATGFRFLGRQYFVLVTSSK